MFKDKIKSQETTIKTVPIITLTSRAYSLFTSKCNSVFLTLTLYRAKIFYRIFIFALNLEGYQNFLYFMHSNHWLVIGVIILCAFQISQHIEAIQKLCATSLGTQGLKQLICYILFKLERPYFKHLSFTHKVSKWGKPSIWSFEIVKLHRQKCFFSLLGRQVTKMTNDMKCQCDSSVFKYSEMQTCSVFGDDYCSEVYSQHVNARQLVNYDRIDPQTPTSSVIIFH